METYSCGIKGTLTDVMGLGTVSLRPHHMLLRITGGSITIHSSTPGIPIPATKAARSSLPPTWPAAQIAYSPPTTISATFQVGRDAVTPGRWSTTTPPASPPAPAAGNHISRPAGEALLWTGSTRITIWQRPQARA